MTGCLQGGSSVKSWF